MATDEMGIVVTVLGEVVPYAIVDEKTGEEVAGVNLRVPGDVVGVVVDGDISRKLNMGEIWRVSGKAMVSKRKAQLRIFQPTHMERIKEVTAAAGPTVDFGNSSDARKESTRTSKSTT